MSVDPKKIVIFDKSIVISNTETITEQTDKGSNGQIRFNNTTYKFEGYHSVLGADIFGNIWRPFTQDVASTSNLGVFRVGNNLVINPTTGIMSSIASGSGRIKQLVITVSPIVGAADYLSINEAISNAIGTPAGNYLDGSITSIIGSAPSPIYPFYIQLAPGQYSEVLNQIILPDYVSLVGEDNYNSVITQNAGNTTVSTGSMLIAGNNSEISNLVIKLADISNSSVSNSLLIDNKSNVSIDKCIFTCESNINTTDNTYLIYMNTTNTSTNTNSISNCQFLLNSNTLTGNCTAINILNTTPRIINNKIDLSLSSTLNTTGLSLSNCDITESVIDKTYVENLTLSNNYYNTTSIGTNKGILLDNSPVFLKNSIIEVANDPQFNSINYGLVFNSDTPLITSTSNNVISFTNSIGVPSIIQSSNSGIVNFNTLGFQNNQYLAVTGSSVNDGIYRIRTVASTTMTLETGFEVITELASISNDITLKALYFTDIQQCKISGTTNSIINGDSNDNYIFNLYDTISQGGSYNIEPSYSIYRSYKTITVGKINCDYNTLNDAMLSIVDNSSNTRYLIKIQSGIYHESSSIICKQFVNIEGNGDSNTSLYFYQADDSFNIPTSNSSCLLLASNMSITNLTIMNISTLDTANSTSTVLYNPTPIYNFLMENVIITSNCSSMYNTGIYLVNVTKPILYNVNITAYSTTASSVNVGIHNDMCNNFNYHNVTSTTNSSNSSINYAINLIDSGGNIYNSELASNSASIENIGIKTENANMVQKLIQIYNGQIRARDAIDYSVYADNYYTIVCNGVQLLGDTQTNSISSRVFCCGCYTFDNSNDIYNIQSLNNRGQNEQQIYKTLTIGDTAGKLNATGTDNLIIGVSAGSNVTTASYNTLLGSYAGNSITTSNNNTLVGSSSGQSISTGSFNTITGSNAGISITTGSENTINGYNIGNSLNTGSQNILIGSNCAAALTTGNLNVFVGTNSGINSITSNTNTYIGAYSGSNNQTGDNNNYIGYQSGLENINGNDNVMLGTQSGYTNQSNAIVSIGNYAGYNNTASIKNTYLGTNSGYNNIAGDCNTYLGNNTGYSTPSATGGFNTVIGNEAGYSLTTGSRNVLLGSTSSSNGLSNDSAGWSLTSGNDNVHIGVSAGNTASSSINNVIIGSTTGTSITTASNNVLIGKNAGNTLNTSGQNVIIGTNSGDVYNAGNGLIVGYRAGTGYTGSEAFAIGYQAGSNVSGDFNMFMGYNSGGLPKLDTTGAYNIAIGPYTGFNLSSGTRNVILGSGDSAGSSGKQINTGSDNTLMGYKSGSALTGGVGNTLVGSNSGANLTTGNDNLVLGYKSGFNLNSGSFNVILGPETGYNINNGIGNIYTGYQAGYYNSSGSYNINMGYQSGYTSTGNEYNIHIGHKAGYSSEADNNLFLGYQTGLNNTFGTNNIFIGLEAGAGVNPNTQQIGDNNLFLGTNAGYSNDNGYRNIYLGYKSGYSSIGGSKNIFIGENAGSQGTTSHNIFIGTSTSDTAGVGYKSDTTGQYNVFLGHDVGIENTIGKDNIFLGDKAGRENIDGIENIYIGTNAGRQANASTSNYNIAIGSDAGINNQSGTENILIGRKVAGLVTSTDYNQNIIIGSEAGQNIQQDNQIFIGTNAGQSNTTGDRNIFIGLNAGKLNDISDDNVVIGSDAGVSLIGNGLLGDNVIIGTQAGHDLTIGTNNIYIGSSAGSNAVTSINNVVIGAYAMTNGDSSNVIIIGHNAGQSNNADNNIFIGSNAGVNNDTGIGNIFVGHEAGYAITNSNGNIVIGNLAASTGRIADNNIVLGNETASNVVNKQDFINNIVMGSGAGKTSNLAINSIMIGTNTVGLGTGGDVNIIMGNNTAVNLGDPHNYYSTTLTEITIVSNYTIIDIPFGTGAYYFNYGDTIIVENNAFDTTYQTTISDISPISIDGYTKTQIVFDTLPNYTYPIGSILYVKNVKTDKIGKIDYSKSSSNMCIGDHCGYDLTSGSKNSAIGDSAMYSNKVGKYNITLGTEAGYSLNTDNNLCLGIKSGYSIDTYKSTNTTNDYRFYQSNNTIVSNSSNFASLPYGTVFEIEGSSSNDNRYNINNSTANSVIVQGYPRIIENGLNVSPSQADFILGSSEIFYINYTVTTNIQFYSDRIIINYATSGLATNAYNTIQNITHFTISGSTFNNGIKVLDYNVGNINVIKLSGSQITIFTIQNNYQEVNNNNVTLTINNIAVTYLLDAATNTSFNNNIFSSDIINIQYGNKGSVYKLSNSQPYYFYNLYFFDTINQTSFAINGAIVDKQIVNNTNVTDNINKLYIQGYDTSITIENVILPLDTIPSSGMHATLFNISDNTIQIVGYGTNAYFVLPNGPTCSPYISNSLIEIIGSQYNDGYYFIKSASSSQNFISGSKYGFILYVDEAYPIKAQENNTGSVIMKRVAITNNVFNSIYNSSSEFKGNIIKIKYRNSAYQNYAFGTYVLENYYNGWFGMNDNLLKFFEYPEIFIGAPSNNLTLGSLTLDMKFCDTGIKTITNNYISSNDLIFQTSNIAFSNVSSNFSIYSSNNTITTSIDYEFVHIVAPVIIKIEGSVNNNDGFFLVTSNPRPFTTLYLDSASVLINELNSTSITLKTNSISSYLGNINLSNMVIGKNYLIQGSKYNDDKIVSIYNGTNTISKNSVYLSNASSIINDTYNDFCYSLTSNLALNDNIGATTNVGYFQNFTLNTVPTIVNSSTTLSFTYSDPTTITLGQVIANQYLKLTGTTPTNNYDGLYCVDTVSTILGGYQISFLQKYQDKNGNIQTGTPFSGALFTSCNIISNQFIFNGNFSIFNGSVGYTARNLDWNTVISGFGENAKYMKFTCRDGTITNFNSKYPTTIMGSSTNNSLTFQLESYNLNVSNVAVSLVETCPIQNIYAGSGDPFSYTHFCSYMIDFGSPNPSTRASDIYRNRMHPIIYSGTNITFYEGGSFGHPGALYTFSNSTNTITASGFSSASNSNNIIYGKLFSKDNFAMFYPGQIIYSIDQSKYLLISSISSDFNTLYLDSTFSTVSNMGPTGAKFSTQFSIYDATLNIKNIDTTKFNNTYLLQTFKTPTSTGLFIDSDKTLSELYFPINTISTSNSSVSSMTVSNIVNVDTQTLSNISFHYNIVNASGGYDITFDSTTNQITSTISNLSGFQANEFIMISNSANNNGLYLIDTAGSTSTTIKISSSYPLVTEQYSTPTFIANNLSSSLINDLSIYNNSLTLTISGTVSNNNTFSVNKALSNVIYFDSPNVVTEGTVSATIASSSDFINSFTKLQELCMNHTMLIPTDNIIDNYTHISFHNDTVTGSSDISFYSSNNTITSITTNLSSFLLSEYILISGTSLNNGLIRINDTVTPTSNTIIISSQYPLINEINTSSQILANNINSSNITLTDLSVFGGKQDLIVLLTELNNNTYLSNIGTNSAYSIFIDSPSVVTETPKYCTIEKSILIDETSSVTGVNDDTINYTISNYSNLSFHNVTINGFSGNTIFYSSNNTITSTTTDFSVLLRSEYIQIYSNLNNGLFRINDSISPTTNTLIIAPEYTLVSNVSSSIYIIANNINSSNIISSNLAVYDIGNEPLIISNTINNNTTYTTYQNQTGIPNSPYSLPISYPYFTTESPLTCTIKRQKITNQLSYTNLSFHKISLGGGGPITDITFYNSNNTITSITTDLSIFLKSEFIQVYSSLNNGLFRINDSIAPTSNTIIIAPEYTLVSNVSNYASINANNLNSSDIITSNLSVFNGLSQLVVTNTVYNNNYLNISTFPNSVSPYSIILSTQVYNETPVSCTIGEFIYQNSGDISFNNNQITGVDNAVDLGIFRTGQKLAITATSYNNSNITISDSIIPSNSSIITQQSLVNELNTIATLTKQIDFTIIGEPVQSQITNTYTDLYHYEDAEGNNTMIGSFAGQYVGSLNNAIYNVIIGSRCGQVNHGSGNIFIGNDSRLANNSTDGSTTYTNKFAVYKNNSLGIPSNPLLGGDFGTGRVGINTISPESFTLSSDISITDTKLVVNGGAIANSFSPFTGCHIVKFADTNTSNVIFNDTSNIIINDTSNVTSNIIVTSNKINVIPGMIMSSTGDVIISSIINTFCTVVPSTINNDKKVIGVYAYSEQSKSDKSQEYIIDINGNYVKNVNYNNKMVTLNYIASIGEGCLLVSNYGGEIENGDYITTCPIAGYGSLQNDDIMHSYTVAKCTQNINWSSIPYNITYNNKQYKTIMVSCTYHCG